MTKTNQSSEIKWLLVLYVLTHFLSLFNGGIHFDDWFLFGASADVLTQEFSTKAGSIGPLIGHYHYWITQAPGGAYIYRWISFLSFAVATFAFWSILLKTAFTSKYERIALTVLFVLFPLNLSRIAGINTIASIFYALFFLALAISLGRGHWARRIVVWALFFVAMIHASLILFFAACYLVWWLYDRKLGLSNIDFLKKRLPEMIGLPVLAVLFRKYFLQIQAENYNQISILSPLEIYRHLNRVIYESYFEKLFPFLKNPEILLYAKRALFLVPLLAFLLACFQIVKLYRIRKQLSPYHLALKPSLYFFTGLILFVLAAFPYIVVGKTPTSFWFDRWHDRTELLFPAAFSLMTVGWWMCFLYFITRFKNKKLAFLISAAPTFVLFVSFFLQHIAIYKHVQSEWWTQQAIIEELKTNSQLRETFDQANIIAVDDQTGLDGQFGLTRFTYEFDQAFGGRRWLVEFEKTLANRGVEYYTSTYHSDAFVKKLAKLDHFEPTGKCVLWKIFPGSIDLKQASFFSWLGILKKSIFQPSQFNTVLHQLVKTSVAEMNCPYAKKD